MKFITAIARLLVGVLFIASGLIKANDPIGFSYKLQEYFEVLHLSFLMPLSLALAILICFVEVLLGILLLLGIYRNLVLWVLSLMMAFFTFLTFYSAYFNKVTSCGCFGDAIPFTPNQFFQLFLSNRPDIRQRLYPVRCVMCTYVGVFCMYV